MIHRMKRMRARRGVLGLVAGGLVALAALPGTALPGTALAAEAAPTPEGAAAKHQSSLAELVLAIRADRCDQVATLLKQGQDPNMQDAFGYTPLTVAALELRPACIKALIEHQADVNIPSAGGWTPLIGAAMSGAGTEVMEPLLKGGADINARNQWGCTALYYAAGFGSVTAVDYLIKRGAAVEGTGGECPSVMRIAEIKGFTAVIERLKQAGAKPTAPPAQGQKESAKPAAADDKS